MRALPLVQESKYHYSFFYVSNLEHSLLLMNLIDFLCGLAVDDSVYGWMEIYTKADLNPAVLMGMTHCQSMKTLL